jgi:asparagine synthase (glutamine-hydrolysing)
MCGIVGVLQFDGRRAPIEEAYIGRLRDVMRHRGPDGAGSWIAPDGQVALANRRLAVIDLSPSASQPMSDPSGTVWLTFNGEIYNHAALRRELEALGCRFRSDGSDSEVIVHAYRQWGLDAVHHLRGMFAFALWDAAERRLWLVRDRLGIKPLYYCVHAGRFLFASEIKALLADRELPRKMNEEALFHYLSFLTVPAPATLFSGICKLSAASMLLVHCDGRVEERRYWDPLQSRRQVSGTDAEIAQDLLAQLRTAVRLHKVSDVPIGTFLSGGLDSSTITALCGEGDAAPVRAFTVGYDKDYGSYRNEIEYAELAARNAGATLAEVRLNYDDALDFLPRMIESQDEPIADPVCIPLHYVAKLARDHGVIVCLVGEGADELFIGYPNWQRALTLQRINDRLPHLPGLKALGLAALKAWGKEGAQPYDWLDRARHGLPLFWGGAEAFTASAKAQILSPRLRTEFAGRSSWDAIAPIHDRYMTSADTPSALGWMSYLDVNFRLPELLLMRVDKMTMGNSVEARVPFLDHELVEFAFGMPDEVKLRNRELKAVLKKAARGLIPNELVERRKQGFGVPIHEWLLSGLPRRYTAAVDAFVSATDTLDKDAVGHLFSQPGRAGLQWCLLNVSLWWRQYIQQIPN